MYFVDQWPEAVVDMNLSLGWSGFQPGDTLLKFINQAAYVDSLPEFLTKIDDLGTYNSLPASVTASDSSGNIAAYMMAMAPIRNNSYPHKGS